jgi:iron(III) transport system permease protein
VTRHPVLRPDAALGACALFLAAFVVWPLARLVGSLAVDPAALGALAAPLNRAAALNTVILATSVLGVALALGVPLGFLVGRTDLPGASAWRALATLPFVVPPYVAAIAWIALLNPTNGPLNRLFATIGFGPFDIYTLPGMVMVLGFEATPLVMLATAAALSRMDASLEEQARIAGAGPLAAIWRVTVPLAAPAVAESASLVLASASAAFGVPYLLSTGSATPDPVLTTRILQALDLDPRAGRPIAVALSLALLAFGVGLPAIAAAIARRSRVTTVGGKAARAAPFRLGVWTAPALAFVAAFVGIAAFLPLGTLIATSLLTRFGGGFAADNLTFANYGAVLVGRSDTLGALGRSLGLAAGAATAAVGIGALVAWARARTDVPGVSALAALARLPFAVPGTVLALGLILAWSQEIRVILGDRVTLALYLPDTVWLLGLAYTVKFLAYPLGHADAGLSAVDRSLEEAARVSGAGFGQVMVRIVGPLLRPQLVAGWFLVFGAAFSEVTMSLLLAGPDTRVVGGLLFDLQTYGDPPSAAVLAVVVAGVALGASGIAAGVGR